RSQDLDRVGRLRDGRGGDRLEQLALDLLVDGLEQLGLAGEVVIERSARDARAAHDLLGAHAGVAALREHRARRGHQRCACRLRLLGLRGAGASTPALVAQRRLPFDMHAVCMLNTYSLYVTPCKAFPADEGGAMSTQTAPAATHTPPGPAAARAWVE